MQLTIDSTQSLDDVLRVVGALYDVHLQVAPNGAAANSAPNGAAPTRAVSEKRPASAAKASAGTSARTGRSNRSSGRRPSTSSRSARGGSRGRSSRVAPSEIRTWAAQNGFEVSSRGRIPAKVISAYTKAHH